jgi:membrane protein DedA with SNARE-associated domain
MVEWILALPFGWAALFLACVAMVRSQCTYWAGRAINAGLLRTRWAAKLKADRARKGIEALERWGWPIIPLSFLTVGFQTAVNAGAGIVGWRWGRYTLAAVLGWVTWGLAYAAGLLAVFGAALTLAARSPWLAVAAGAAAAVVAVVAVRHRRRRLGASAGSVETAGDFLIAQVVVSGRPDGNLWPADQEDDTGDQPSPHDDDGDGQQGDGVGVHRIPPFSPAGG